MKNKFNEMSQQIEFLQREKKKIIIEKDDERARLEARVRALEKELQENKKIIIEKDNEKTKLEKKYDRIKEYTPNFDMLYKFTIAVIGIKGSGKTQLLRGICCRYSKKFDEGSMSSTGEVRDFDKKSGFLFIQMYFMMMSSR